MRLTAGTVKAALEGGPAFLAALERIAAGAGTLDDAETIAGDVIEAAVMFDPALAPFAVIAEVALTLLPYARPGTAGEGQTTPPPHGWIGR